MDIEVLLQVALRVLPALLVLVLGFIAAADQKSRERWADLLYQAGSLRPEQRTDPKVQRGVRLPFFLVALALLWWPIRYYRYATTIVEIKSDLYSRPRVSTPPAQNPAPGAAAAGAPAGSASSADALPDAP